MTDRPILFSAPMVRALLAGSKTQTRRVIKPQPAADFVEAKFNAPGMVVRPAALFGSDTHKAFRRLPKPGDRLWVKETFARGADTHGGKPWPIYGANYSGAGDGSYACLKPWTSSLYMPRAFSRLTLTVTDVRIQWVQDISEEDAIAEGCRLGIGNETSSNAVFEYACLWDHINAKRPGCAWADNPWVVAVSFTVERRNIDEVASPHAFRTASAA